MFSAIRVKVIAQVRQMYLIQVKKPGLWGQFLRKWRRFFIGIFNPSYIQKSIDQNREGACNRCGACCELLFKCPFLGRDAQKLPYCRVYGDLRPTNCHTYPFDATDSEVDICGFSFKK